jgi:hypothetical protein
MFYIIAFLIIGIVGGLLLWLKTRRIKYVIIFSVSILLMLLLSIIIWFGTYNIRQNSLYEKVTQKGELIIDYYDTGNNNIHYQYFYMNKKVYCVEESYDNTYVRICPKIHYMDKISGYDMYSELYEKSDKFTLLYKTEFTPDYDPVDYPHSIIHLKNVGFFEFDCMDRLACIEHFDSLGLTVLNEEIHIKFREKAEETIK